MNGLNQYKLFNEIDYKLNIPSNIIVAGSSLSGKTTFLLTLLDNAEKMFNPCPNEIVYCYGEYNENIPRLEAKGFTVLYGIPTEEFIMSRQKPFVLILDDLMLLTNKKYLDDLFTKKSHHNNFCIIFLTQNPFDKNLSTARQNAHYIVMMRAPNAILHIRNLGIQLFPGKVNEFMKAYNDATKELYGYLLIDIHPSSFNELRLRTDIFSNNPTIYIL